MKKIVAQIVILTLASLTTVKAQNLDDGKFPNLPDPLVTESGEKVNDVTTWENVRRKEILKIFTDSVYGRSPQPREYTCHFKVSRITPIANGTAVQKMVELTIKGPNGSHQFEFPVYIPKSNKPVPVFILFTHRDRMVDTTYTSDNFPLNNLILPRGYGVAINNAIDYNEEDSKSYKKGLLELFNMNGPYDWKSLSARAFIASRIIDYLQTDPDIDASKIAVIGHSRSGKAALWCGAQDERVALTIPNCSGSAGDALYRNNEGQTIKVSKERRVYWFSDKYFDYSEKDLTLPFDSHQLLALVAPRLLAQGVGSKDGWADPTGQFYSAVFAQPVFNLYGKAEIKWTVANAPDRSSIENIELTNGNMHFHQRFGPHGLTHYDWEQYLDFADTNF